MQVEASPGTTTCMGAPFKNLTVPKGPDLSAQVETKLVPAVPGYGNASINEEPCDVTPEYSPPIPWPAAEPLEGRKPMKLGK